MFGTILNVISIILGTTIGMCAEGKFSEKLRTTLMAALGVFVSLTGADLYLKSENSIIPLGGIVLGVCIGEALNIEDGIELFGGWLQVKFQRFTGGTDSDKRRRFINAFLTATLLFCIGPMAVLGSIQDGIGQGVQLLAIKSLLDGITAIAFASTLGIGVAFSAIPLFIYQGFLTLLSVQADKFLSDAMITEMSAAGGIMLVCIGLSNMLEIKKIRVSSMLPALIITPGIVWLTALF